MDCHFGRRELTSCNTHEFPEHAVFTPIWACHLGHPQNEQGASQRPMDDFSLTTSCDVWAKLEETGLGSNKPVSGNTAGLSRGARNLCWLLKTIIGLSLNHKNDY